MAFVTRTSGSTIEPPNLSGFLSIGREGDDPRMLAPVGLCAHYQRKTASKCSPSRAGPEVRIPLAPGERVSNEPASAALRPRRKDSCTVGQLHLNMFARESGMHRSLAGRKIMVRLARRRL